MLQEMGRYEASNRQTFAALAQDPECVPCVGLIAQNLMALGYLEEAADAFAHAMQTDADGLADLHAEQLDRLEMMLAEPADYGARYRVLVQDAASALSIGAWEEAERLLSRVCAMPRRDERCHALQSLYFQARGDIAKAIQSAKAACRATPHSVRAYCTLAEKYGAAKQRGNALRTLRLAASRTLTADDERLLCQTALAAGFPLVPLKALDRLGSHVRTLYNKAVLLLAAGQYQRALQALDQARALDPDDVPSRFLRRTAQALAALPHGQAADPVYGLRLYPALSDADSQDCYRDFLEAAGGDAGAFALRLQADTALFRMLLYQAENPYTDITGLLEQVIPLLSENVKEKLLRAILLTPVGGLAEKQLAIRFLTQGNAKPFVLWHGGRLHFIRPGEGNETAGSMQLKEHLLRAEHAGYDPRLITHALRLLRQLPERARLRAAAAESGVFWAAVRMHYADTMDAGRRPDSPK
jgi:tetratricopeptide (TPR) repeat protein